MWRSHPMLDAFEREQMRKQPPDYARNLRLYEAMYKHARRLGVFPLKKPLEGIEHDIHLARALNRVRHHPGADRSRA